MGALKFAKTAWSNFQIYLSKKVFSNFKIYERAYNASKFSGEWLWALNLVSC